MEERRQKKNGEGERSEEEELDEGFEGGIGTKTIRKMEKKKIELERNEEGERYEGE